MASRVKPANDHPQPLRLPKAMAVRLLGIYTRMVTAQAAWNDAYALACEAFDLDPSKSEWRINFETGLFERNGPQAVVPPLPETEIIQ